MQIDGKQYYGVRNKKTKISGGAERNALLNLLILSVLLYVLFYGCILTASSSSCCFDFSSLSLPPIWNVTPELARINTHHLI